jgi:hypothetical protein
MPTKPKRPTKAKPKAQPRAAAKTGGSRIDLRVTFPAAVGVRIRAAATAEHREINDLARHAILTYLDNRRPAKRRRRPAA